MECPKCGSNDIQTEGGQSFCCVCGCLVEEYNIVSEVTFLERSNGSASMGGFVMGPNSKRCAIPGMYDPTEGRMQTLERAKRLIQEIASQRELGEHFVEAAHQIYKLAAKSNFVRGRRSSTVCACCLYAICRQEQSPHLLLDFADALQINVFVLGHTFLRLCQLLHLQLPVIDPAIYIPRFAAELQLGEKTDVVSNFAVRLIGQMKRDWMSTGRGHAGICGAALLMSARRYGFPVTQKQMIEVVRICSLTLTARLREFGETPTSTFSFAEFDKGEREQPDAVDPPAFKRARLGDAIRDDEGKKEEEEPISIEIPQDYSEGGPHAPPDIPEIPDDEIDNYINTTEEVQTKTKMWEEMNSDYLEQQKLKLENPDKKGGQKRKRKTTVKKPAENTAEAMSDMLKKKVSTKINYTALEGLFTNAPGASATSDEKSHNGQQRTRLPSVLEFGGESSTHYDDEFDDDYDEDAFEDDWE